MLKKYFIVFILPAVFFVLSCANNQNKSDCANFKTGEFHIKPKNGNPGFLLVRNDSIQFETNKKTDHVEAYGIRWTDLCKYELTFLYETSVNPAFATKDPVRDSIRRIPMDVDIVAVGNNYYVYRIKKKGNYPVFGDTIWFQPKGE